MALEIKIDPTRCMGSGNCQFWAPGVFEIGPDDVAVVVDIDAAPREKIILAAKGCPTQAICLAEDGEPLA